MDLAIPPDLSELPEGDKGISASPEGAEKSLKKHTVEILKKDGMNTVEIPDEVITNSTPLWEDFVVGKFLDLAPHIAKVHKVLNRIWCYGDSTAKVGLEIVHLQEDVIGDEGKENEENISLQVGEKSLNNVKEVREEEVKGKENAWLTPMKIGKVQNSSSQTNTPEIQISVSKFSFLMDEREEGEILKDDDMLEGMEEDEMNGRDLLEDDIIDQSVKEWKKLDS
ncbi:hypothetical protein F2Q69_00021974 [Brassica cretica]|uniref:DUF4283 domain-containing protein n=1 Tax=Brassica cretica TaxID=69181 RepID=A0A8S9Q627_BRACR|nr:hypothetical protein F2Q69_00021974 [Brassica cretica]